jgi:hypothetical protein
MQLLLNLQQKEMITCYTILNKGEQGVITFSTPAPAPKVQGGDHPKITAGEGIGACYTTQE